MSGGYEDGARVGEDAVRLARGLVSPLDRGVWWEMGMVVVVVVLRRLRLRLPGHLRRELFLAVGGDPCSG